MSDDLVEKISSLVEEEHVALSQYMNEFAVKIALVCLMGDRFRNDQDVLEFRRLYGIVSLEKSLSLVLISFSLPEFPMY